MDVDETLFHTKAKVKVVKNGETIKELSNQEFNTYLLGPGESYDFGIFRNAEFFRKTSEPIVPILKRINRILHNIEVGKRNSKVILLTARSPFDNKKEFENTFKDYGVQIDDVEIRTVGERSGTIPIKKQKTVREYLKKGNYKRARMFDDSQANLEAFLQLKREFPSVDFTAIKVKEDGSTELLPN